LSRILFIILFILLSGCNSSMKSARARDLRAKTDRANDIHNAAMAEREALTPARLAAKENLILTGAIAGVVLILVLAGSGSYFIVGFSVAKVRQVNLMLIPLDKATRQYPLVISNGNRAYLPNTGERNDLRQNQLPYPELVNGSHAVQLSGVRFNSYEDYQAQKLLKGGDAYY
jgi:hypothetical protein